MVTTKGRTAHTTKKSMLGMIAVWGGGGAERTNDLCKGEVWELLSVVEGLGWTHVLVFSTFFF